jgi:hypothetical protein
VGYVASALFFVLALIAAASILYLTVREYWAEIIGALRGEVPARTTARPWVRGVRAQVRPRPVSVQAQGQQRAAV